jgi:hypothetical protein
MEVEMTVKGIIRGQTIELDEPLPYPEGEVVELNVQPAAGALGRAGSPAAILAAMRSVPHVEPEAVDELERAIEEGKRPVSFRGVFDDIDE